MAEEEKSEKPRSNGRDDEVPGLPKGRRLGDIIVIPLKEDPHKIDESKMDFSIPFWVGDPDR